MMFQMLLRAFVECVYSMYSIIVFDVIKTFAQHTYTTQTFVLLPNTKFCIQKIVSKKSKTRERKNTGEGRDGDR